MYIIVSGLAHIIHAEEKTYEPGTKVKIRRTVAFGGI